MVRGLAHASLLFAVAHLPGGRRAYHAFTRSLLRSQERVLRKLQRVWPGYERVWRERCGLDLPGSRIWIHQPGPAPFAPLAAYLLTGHGGVSTWSRDAFSGRYVRAAVQAVLAAAFEDNPTIAARRRVIAGLADGSVADLLGATGGWVAEVSDPARIPLDAGSIDLCHSGGALEHLTPGALASFLRESFRVLRPGGVVSHVFDHRDHLRHVDGRWPFLLHMSLPDSVYRPLFGHPLLFHNRLSPAEVAEMLGAAGFERVAERRFVLPAKRYVDAGAADAGEPGVPAWLGGGRLARLSREDRHTAAIHYLYRKPVRW